MPNIYNNVLYELCVKKNPEVEGGDIMSKSVRNWFKIDNWMRHHNLSVAKIQLALGFKNHGVVSHTIAGRKNNRKVLKLLVDKGCPCRFLALPDDMKKAA